MAHSTDTGIRVSKTLRNRVEQMKRAWDVTRMEDGIEAALDRLDELEARIGALEGTETETDDEDEVEDDEDAEEEE